MKQFVRDWALIIAIVAGITGYFAYAALPLSAQVHHVTAQAVAWAQPMFIFAMLFLTFCRVEPRELRFHWWHLWLLLFQVGCFVGIGTVLIIMPHSGMRVVLEGAMICLICPTATAAAVITRRLGGSVASVTTYTVLINMAAALIIPLMVPLVHPNPDMGIGTAMVLILGKIFPLLLMPLVTAFLLRYLFPQVCERLGAHAELSFYLWAVSLSLALAVTTRSIVHTHIDLVTQLCLVGVSLVSCLLQFWLGRRIGARYHDRVTAGQALGQKNTVLAIWLGYTFFTPVTAIVGGFYSIWHNIINSYQLYRHTHSQK